MSYRSHILGLIFLQLSCAAKEQPCCPSESESGKNDVEICSGGGLDCEDLKRSGDMAGTLGDFCVYHADCALGSCIGQRCAVACDAFNTTCPGDTACEITGDISGFCFHRCDTADVSCPGGLQCNESGFCERPTPSPTEVNVPPNCCASDSDCENGSCYKAGQEDSVGGTCRFLPRDHGCWSDSDCGLFACEGSTWPETMCGAAAPIEPGSCVPTTTSGTVTCGPTRFGQSAAQPPGHHDTCVAGQEQCWDCARVNPGNGTLTRNPTCGNLGLLPADVCEFHSEGESATASKQCDGDEDCAPGTSCFWFESADERGTQCTSSALCEDCSEMMKVCRNDSDCDGRMEVCSSLSAEGRHQFSQQIFVCVSG